MTVTQESENQNQISEPQPTSHEITDLAPVMFFDGLEGFVFNNHVVKFNAFETIISKSKDNKTVIQQRTLAHIVVTHTVLDQIVRWLSENVALRNEQILKSTQNSEHFERMEQTGIMSSE